MIEETTYALDEAAKASGVPPRTIRRWATNGLLKPRRATRSAHRRFTRRDILSAKIVYALRTEGVAIETSKDILARILPMFEAECLMRISEVTRIAGHN